MLRCGILICLYITVLRRWYEGVKCIEQAQVHVIGSVNQDVGRTNRAMRLTMGMKPCYRACKTMWPVEEEEAALTANQILPQERMAAGRIHDLFDHALDASLEQSGVTAYATDESAGPRSRSSAAGSPRSRAPISPSP